MADVEQMGAYSRRALRFKEGRTARSHSAGAGRQDALNAAALAKARPAEPAAPPRGAPPVLPVAGRVEQLGISAAFLRGAADAPGPHSRPDPSPKTRGQWDLGFYNPAWGKLLGPTLAGRVGALLHRPFCSFVNSFMWHSGNGSIQGAHRDRPTLDITVGLPLLLEGAPQWPLYLERLDGRLWQFPSKPGSMLVMDGRQRTHWRNPFAGTRAAALLLHYLAPVVLWRGLLPARTCRLLAAADASDRHAAMPDALAACLALAQRIIPVSNSPTAACRGPLPALSGETPKKGGASFLVPLTGEAVLTLGPSARLPLHPGDGVAFLPNTKYRLEWAADVPGWAIKGRSERPAAWNENRQPAAEPSAAEVPVLDDTASMPG